MFDQSRCSSREISSTLTRSPLPTLTSIWPAGSLARVLIGSWLPPTAALHRQERVGFARPPATRLIGRERAGLHPRPAGHDVVDDRPGRFDFVAAREERRVAQQCVEQ